MENLKEVTCKVVVIEKEIEINKTKMIIFNDENEIGYYEIYSDGDTEEILYYQKNSTTEEILPLFERDYNKELNIYIDEDLEKKGFYIKDKEIYSHEILLGCL